MLRKLYDEAQSLSAGRHRISLNLDTGTKLLGNTDELRSAFGNLISNAIRYTPAGGDISLNWAIAMGRAYFPYRTAAWALNPNISRVLRNDSIGLTMGVRVKRGVPDWVSPLSSMC